MNTALDDISREPVAFTVDGACGASGVGRTTLYQAMSDDPEKRQGLPFLPSLKVGRRRLIRSEALRGWLATIESASLKQAA